MPLTDALRRFVRQEFNLEIPVDALRPDSVPAHLHMNFRVLAEDGRQLAMGRDLHALKKELGREAETILREEAAIPEGEQHTGWTMGDLPELMEIERDGQTLVGYPALVDAESAVVLQVFDSPEKARELHRAGVRRLLAIAFRERIRDLQKILAKDVKLAPLVADIVAASLERAFLAGDAPTTAKDFARRVEEGRSRFGLIAQEIARSAAGIVAEHASLQKKLAALEKSFPQAAADVRQQLERLLAPGWLARTRVGAYPALAALPARGVAAAGQAARRPGARRAPCRRGGEDRDALPARRGGPRPLRRPAGRARAVRLAAGRAARLALRPGAAHASAGFGQAPRQTLADSPAMKPVFGALGYAAANLLHPRMLWLMIWPMLVAAGFWGIAALFLWVRTALRIAEVIQSGLDFFHLQAPDAAMIAANAVLFLLFVPLVWLTALFILGVFGMGEMVEHVAAQSFPALERRRGGGTVGSIANGIATLIGMLALAVVTLPLWLLAPLWPLIPLAIFAWASQRLLRYDALAEHADRQEMRQIFRQRRGHLYLLGLLMALIAYVPVVGFVAPVLFGLAFIRYLLGALAEHRSAPAKAA